MTRSHKIEICIAISVAVLLAGSALALIRWQRQRTILLRGAVLIEDLNSLILPVSDPELSLGVESTTESALLS